MNKCFHELVWAIGPLEAKISDAQEKLDEEEISQEDAITLEEQIAHLKQKLEELHVAIKSAASNPV